MRSFAGTPEKISERAEFFRDVADALFEDGVFDDRVVLRGARIPVAVQGYFLLNDAYKDWRIEDGHRTEDPKIAALQCVAIATFQPLRPIDPTDARTTAEARCNELFALAVAAATLGIDIDASPENFHLRLLDVLSACRSETLEAYRVDRAAEIIRPLDKYRLTIHDSDKLAINALITIFELMSGHHG